LHPTSLPGKFGIGDLGPSAFEFCQTLAAAGQTYWQILPLGPTALGDSPYQSLSAFAGNSLLISPERLVLDGLIEQRLIEPGPALPVRVDYAAVREWKNGLLRSAYQRFEEGDLLRSDFDEFCLDEAAWLQDWSLYSAIKHSHGESAWFQWPQELKLRELDVIGRARDELASEIGFYEFCQFIFFRQWFDLKKHAESLGIRIIGDIPIFVALDSADVWTHREQFKLTAEGDPLVVAGVPPDYFSKTGQLWGNPICDWDAMRSDGFAWWIARVAHLLKLVDVIRMDHFRGFVATWEVPGTDETAEHGRWVDVPGHELFAALEAHLTKLPLIAEDLGAITPEVEALRDKFDYPGMRILEYGFGGDARNRDLPHNYEPHTVAYTGTHDNDTVMGWFAGLDEKTREHVLGYLGLGENEAINWSMIRALYASIADTVIVPMQDVLGLGSESRMNTPATTEGNWRWRMEEGALTDEIGQRLSRLSELYGRTTEQ
jgi:4-alpha-glucanotransferase